MARYPGIMGGVQPARISAKRLGYVMLLAAAILVVMTFHVAWSRSDGDVFGLLLVEALPLFAVAKLIAKIVRPPTLLIAAEGLTLLNGWRRRRYWRWDQIAAFEYDSRKYRFIRFAYQPSPGCPLKGGWLNISDGRDPQDQVRQLDEALNAARQAGAHAPDVSVPQQSEEAWRKSVHREVLTGAVLATAWFGFIALNNTSRTALVTPISAHFLYVGIVGGALLGFVAATVAIPRILLAFPIPDPRSTVISRTLLIVTIFAIVGGFVGAHTAWRIAEMMTFSGKGVVTKRATFRIVAWRTAKYGRYADIMPFPAAGKTSLPIPTDDYDRLEAAGSGQGVSAYCYPLRTEASGDGVRIVLPPRVRKFEKQRIIPCPPVTDDHWS